MVFGVLSTALFFPMGASEATESIVDPLNPSVYVHPISSGNQSGGRKIVKRDKQQENNEKTAEKQETKKERHVAKTVSRQQGTRSEQLSKKKRKPILMDKHFFAQKVSMATYPDVVPNDDEFETHTFFSGVLGACAGNILYAKR